MQFGWPKTAFPGVFLEPSPASGAAIRQDDRPRQQLRVARVIHKIVFPWGKKKGQCPETAIRDLAYRAGISNIVHIET
jgi:hypothetical protein